MRYTWLARPKSSSTAAVYPAAGVPEPVRLLMERRGLSIDFLQSSYGSLSPWNMLPGAEKAVEFMSRAINSGDKILVHGDFDADGITASATAVRVLRSLGASVDYHLPCRFEEGYGLGETGVNRCIAEGIGLLISVDCGITAIEEVDKLERSGVKVIVTDHHVPGDRLPAASAVVNPELMGDEESPSRHLSGAGVIHTVLRGLFPGPPGSMPGVMEPDLVAVGTVCDMVNITGDNRLLVNRGLEVMRHSPLPGIEALMRVGGLDKAGLTATDLGFVIGPRINSAGRITHADKALSLLLETDVRRAEELAGELDRSNQKRKTLDGEVYQEALEILERTDMPMAVASGEKWHPGVIGISASRIARKLNRPAVLVSWQGEYGKGSARGVPGMPVHTILNEALEMGLLVKFGGHSMAAGLTIERKNYEAFTSFIRQRASSLYSEVEKPVLYIDGGLTADQCSMEVFAAVEKLGPFGEGNPEPVWISRGLYPSSYKTVGHDSRHLQISFQSGGTTLRAIGFDMGGRTSELNRPLDIAFTLKPDKWRGDGTVQLVLEDMKPAAGRNN